ncbi:MAG: hypothetical protein E7357_00715 [Clostridiales bacterium]|nr:hypothetical protein [Clostridiales bacterium]
MQSLLKGTRAYKQLKVDGEKGCFSHAYLVLFDDARNLRGALKTFAKLFFACDEPYTPAQTRVADLIDTESFSDCLFYPAPNEKFVVEDAERLAEECSLKPVEGDKKVFVVADFATATVAAQNKLLKLLEEPPTGVIFLLGATTVFPVLTTVLSRVKKLEITPFETEDIAACLARQYGDKYGVDEYTLCAAASGGSLGGAQNTLEGGAYKTLTDDAFALLLSPLYTLPPLIKRIGETKRKKELFSLMRLIMRDGLIVKANLSKERLFLRSERARIAQIADRFSLNALVFAQERILQAERENFFNATFPQCLETMVADICNKG